MHIVRFLDLDDQFQNEIEKGETFGVSLEDYMNQLFIECEHGDDEHRQWLKDKFKQFRLKFEDGK